MKKSILKLLLLLTVCSVVSGQDNKSTISANRNPGSISVDGVLDEAIWQQLPELGSFTQYTPYNGDPSKQKTSVKIYYNDDAFFIGAVMNDNASDSMMTELGVRDSYETPNAELMAVHISPYNDGINSVYFCVSICGVQSDFKLSAQGIDMNWDAVWESNVKIIDNGWSAEMRIPYSALRLLDQPEQNWGFNVFRKIPRHEELSSWSYVSNELEQWWVHMGELQGIENIRPPVRLSFAPYISAYAEKNTDGHWGTSYNGGMDLKYGITESFTLDMTLIPDFGQVQSDDQELNLTPYEIQHNERRQFFTEGTELFNKADIFYSRRIGAKPVNSDNIQNSLSGDEVITDNPNETQLINATKFSGRTNRGLGIGILNAMTANTVATVEDTVSGDKREIATQPFTNYNMVVLDQTLRNNSFLSLANTNVSRENYMANVTGAEFRIQNPSNTYLVEGTGALSQIHGVDEKITGHKYSFRAGKIAGEFQFEYLLNVVNDKYNQNDLGFLSRNNEIQQYVNLEIHKFKPAGLFLDYHHNLFVFYHRMYNPSEYADFKMEYAFEARFKNFYRLNINVGLGPAERRDYYETRCPGRYVLDNPFYKLDVRLDSNPQKKIITMARAGFVNSINYMTDLSRRWIAAAVTYKASDRFNFGFDFYYRTDKDEPGYVSYDAATDDVYFGNRDRITAINTLNANYLFTNKLSLNFRLRHYWSKANYKSYHRLLDKGELEPANYNNNHDVNYNAFNIDMTMIWNFAPGSELRMNWKNASYDSKTYLVENYWDNLNNTFNLPHLNIFSVKLLYYLDYQTVKNKIL